MKRSRCESSTARSSSTGDSYDSSSESESSYDTSVSVAHSPSPPILPNSRAMKETDRTTSMAFKKSSTASSSSTPAKRLKASIPDKQKKHIEYLFDKAPQYNSSGAPKDVKDRYVSKTSPTRGRMTASQINEGSSKKLTSSGHTVMKEVIEVIDSSASEFHPSDDEDRTESSSSSESENDAHQSKEHVQKRVKMDTKDDTKAYRMLSGKEKGKKPCHKKHSSKTRKSDGKEATRYSREEDTAIIAFVKEKIRIVDMMEHLRETFPDQQPKRTYSSVKSHRNFLFKEWKDTILGKDTSKD
ncbi:uncharacterized protein FA14DRAFT_192500 [Meira miltonrushii]|uniref:Uncharacterized protein n=1 Tax=Meira miltonrushii TaxID=1280837 RepID=A0A316V3Y7_9BASI|nr:uncharacterized protein FA14DRAFT_192500 [Meira miltonrushii]PWN32267.1 hypothetical protein FA14DRAFT_192500 [Meira miltonrushii]